MMMNNRKSAKKNKGYYLAILLCAAAVGLVAWSGAIRKNNAEQASASPVSSESEELPSEEVLNELVGEEEYEQASAPVSMSDTQTTTAMQPTETQLTQPQPQSDLPEQTETLSAEAYEESEAVEVSVTPMVYAKPVSGQILKGFSGDSLVYSLTLGDWRVHNGVDIACEAGATITAAGGGTVISAAKDDRYGMVVVVRHLDETMVYYCGLDKNLAVSEGETVTVGQKLGTVGEIPCECEDGPHLHIMAMHDGEFVDPMELLGIKY